MDGSGGASRWDGGAGGKMPAGDGGNDASTSVDGGGGMVSGGGDSGIGGIGGIGGVGGAAGNRGGGGGVAGVSGAAGSRGGNGGVAGTGGVAGNRGGGGGVGGSGGVGSGNGGAGGIPCGGGAGNGGKGGAQPVERRIPQPCVPPLPTGYCFKSDINDPIGGGVSTTVEGKVGVNHGDSSIINLQLMNGTGGLNDWSAIFEPVLNGALVPGLYDSATQSTSNTAGQMNVSSYSRSCGTVTGKFSIEEMAVDPGNGLKRLSITFEQHCNGIPDALTGVINYQASGAPDPSPALARTISFKGNISRVTYDATADLVYGIDATNKKLAKIDLVTGAATYADVVQIPNDICVDSRRQRLFTVNKGSSLISEYRTSDLTSVRDIPYGGVDWGGPDATHFKIYCGPDKVYVVDASWAPNLFTIEGLDGNNPTAVDRTASASAVGGLTLDSSAKNLYYWYQYGWNAGTLLTYVRRLATDTLAELDISSQSESQFVRDPLDAPALLDECRGLLFVKNKVFDPKNLEKVIHTLPSAFDYLKGASENAYALDPRRGRMATKGYIYELDGYSIVIPTAVANADQLFFDKNGALWFLSMGSSTLKSQVVP